MSTSSTAEYILNKNHIKCRIPPSPLPTLVNKRSPQNHFFDAVLNTIKQKEYVNVSPIKNQEDAAKNFKLFKNARFWSYNYSVFMQLDNDRKFHEVALVKHHNLLKRIVIKDEIVIHYMENPEIMKTVVALLRKGPNCHLKICARGFVEGLLDIMSGSLIFTKCLLIDLKFDHLVSFNSLLRVLQKATHIEVDLNGFYFEDDVGKMLQNWEREDGIIEFILHNVPKTVNKAALNGFIEKKLANNGSFHINFMRSD